MPVARAEPSDGRREMRVRSTFYHAGEAHSDPDTDAGRSSTGVPLRAAEATRVGVCAVDPVVIPYGSIVIVPTADGPRYYIAADTGAAVVRKTASGGATPVIDFYSDRQIGTEYALVMVIPYAGAVPFLKLSKARREECFDYETVSRMAGLK